LIFLPIGLKYRYLKADGLIGTTGTPGLTGSGIPLVQFGVPPIHFGMLQLPFK
jgi:hypothetical protein